jgi:CO/xanthine dehydrogenase FAD-binding subunit
MRPAKFEYFAPNSISDAAKLLAGDGAGRILAGGQSLLAAMNLRLARPSSLIDLRKIPGLDHIDVEGDVVRIGAMVTHARLVTSEPLRKALPIVAMAGRHIAHSTIREHGTMGGSLALADPASEWCTVVTLLGGRVRLLSVRGERWVNARDFFVSFYVTAMAPDEILVEIELPLPVQGTRFGFEEFARQRGAFAIAMVAITLSSPTEASQSLTAAIGGCGPRPVLLNLGPAAERGSLDRGIAEVSSGATLAPPSDIHASSEDRRNIASALLRRCVHDLLQTRGGEG